MLLTGISKTSWVSSSNWTLIGTCRPGAWPGGRRPGSSVDTPRLSGAPSLCPAVDDLSAGSAMVTDMSSWAAGTWVHVWWRRGKLGFIPSGLRSFWLQAEKGFWTFKGEELSLFLKPLSSLQARRLWSILINWSSSSTHAPPPHPKAFSQCLWPEHPAVSHILLDMCNLTAACCR